VAVGRWVLATAPREETTTVVQKLLLRRVAVACRAVMRGDAASGEESEHHRLAIRGADRRGCVMRCWGHRGAVCQEAELRWRRGSGQEGDARSHEEAAAAALHGRWVAAATPHEEEAVAAPTWVGTTSSDC
jgi:hypothetical protein